MKGFYVYCYCYTCGHDWKSLQSPETCPNCSGREFYRERVKLSPPWGLGPVRCSPVAEREPATMLQAAPATEHPVQSTAGTSPTVPSKAKDRQGETTRVSVTRAFTVINGTNTKRGVLP